MDHPVLREISMKCWLETYMTIMKKCSESGLIRFILFLPVQPPNNTCFKLLCAFAVLFYPTVKISERQRSLLHTSTESYREKINLEIARIQLIWVLNEVLKNTSMAFLTQDNWHPVIVTNEFYLLNKKDENFWSPHHWLGQKERWTVHIGIEQLGFWLCEIPLHWHTVNDTLILTQSICLI